MMYGQMTAGSWIYIGAQGILQGTYLSFIEAAKKAFGRPDLTGKFILTGGMGGMSGAQPLAGKMAKGVILVVEVEKSRIERKIKEGYCDYIAEDLDEALKLVDQYTQQGTPASIGLVGNCADVLPELVNRGITPDIVTDQTSAHDPINGYVPNGMTLDEAYALRKTNPKEYEQKAIAAMGEHVQAMLDLQKAGAETFDYGNNIRLMLNKQVWKTLFTSQDLYLPIFVRYSVKERVLSVGLLCQETLKIFTKPIKWQWRCLKKMKRWSTGLKWRKKW